MNNKYEDRKWILMFFFIAVGAIYLLRLLYIQLIDDSYTLTANNQALRYVIEYPARGFVYDRNGKLLVYNEAAYDLMVIPKQAKGIDTLAFCNLLGITVDDYVERLKKAGAYSRFKASVFEKQILAKDYAAISEKLHKFSGFYGQKRTLRHYPKPIAAHLLGYISEVNQNDIDKNPYYKRGDFIGVSGIERSYEEELRGTRGIKVQLVDVHNVVKGSYRNGEYDSLAIPGKNLVCTIDADLQEYGEKLMQNKKGSIVAIDPSSGEILALISSPSYDPNLLVGRDRNVNFKILSANDTLNPLFNRALNARYRPGSIFKMVQSLVALEIGAIVPSTRFHCNRSIIACHGSHSNDDLVNAIIHSCNPYFWNVYKKMIQPGIHKSYFKDSEEGLKVWRHHVSSFGFGSTFNLDIPGSNSGLIPTVEFYDKWYGKGRWAFSTIYSNSIGEGELGVVPIQMANLAAIIANKGYYYTPHVVKGIGDEMQVRDIYKEKIYTTINEKHFATVIDAMESVVSMPGGTASRARIDTISVCGKTGTVQNKDRPDHAVFIAFAPKENPQIAISVYVEYAGFGGSWAAPIASLMIEKYLSGNVIRPEKEQRILDADFIKAEYERKK